jgi:hypothetical protein
MIFLIEGLAGFEGRLRSITVYKKIAHPLRGKDGNVVFAGACNAQEHMQMFMLMYLLL